jgi:hypothetical protein
MADENNYTQNPCSGHFERNRDFCDSYAEKTLGNWLENKRKGIYVFINYHFNRALFVVQSVAPDGRENFVFARWNAPEGKRTVWANQNRLAIPHAISSDGNSHSIRDSYTVT